MTLIRVSVGLEGAFIADGAGRPQMQPVPVAIETILYIVIVYDDAVASGQTVGFAPSIALDAQQLKVACVGGVRQLGVSQLM